MQKRRRIAVMERGGIDVCERHGDWYTPGAEHEHPMIDACKRASREEKDNYRQGGLRHLRAFSNSYQDSENRKNFWINFW